MTNGGEVKKRDPNEIKAEDVYNGLSELQGLAANLLAGQRKINDKLINNPNPPSDTSTDKAEVAQNPRHLPGFYEVIKQIASVLHSAQHLQEVLDKHI